MSGLSSLPFSLGNFVSPPWFVSVLLCSILALVGFGLSFLLTDTRKRPESPS